jgi:hypothetical protein
MKLVKMNLKINGDHYQIYRFPIIICQDGKKELSTSLCGLAFADHQNADEN